MKKCLILCFVFFLAFETNANRIYTYNCPQMIGRASYILEGVISNVEKDFFKIKVGKVYKGKIKSDEILIRKGVESYTSKRWANWEVGQRELIFLEAEKDTVGSKLLNFFSISHRLEDSEIPIINDSVYLALYLSNHSPNWTRKYIDYSLGKYYHLPEMNKRYKLSIYEFREAYSFCIKKHKKIIKACKKDRLMHQSKEIIEINGSKYFQTGWDGLIHSQWLKKRQARNKAFERLIDEYYFGFTDLVPLIWNKSTYKANTGELIKVNK